VRILTLESSEFLRVSLEFFRLLPIILTVISPDVHTYLLKISILKDIKIISELIDEQNAFEEQKKMCSVGSYWLAWFRQELCVHSDGLINMPRCLNFF